MIPLYKEFLQGFPQAAPQQPSVPMSPVNMLSGAIQQARQIMSMGNPRQFVLNSFRNIPPEIQNDPDQILRYLQQNNMLTEDQKQILGLLQQNRPLF